MSTIYYAIADIHGCLDKLDVLHQNIWDDIKRIKAQEHTNNSQKDAEITQFCAVYLGDYIDRGLHSKQVIDTLINRPLGAEVEHIFLCGNHDYTMLQFLQDESVLPQWLTWGGGATLRSYGISYKPGYKPTHVQQKLIKALPASHHKFFREMKAKHVAGSYVFVHAGVRPEVPLEKQTLHDLLWIRDDFLQGPHHTFPKTVVFGHTVFTRPYDKEGYLGIDLGAYRGGKLCAVRLEGGTTQSPHFIYG